MPEGFADYMAQERERLHAERDRLFEQRAEIDRQLAAIAAEFNAIDAYEAAKSGRRSGAKSTGVGRGRGAGGAISPTGRARRGSKREALLQVIRENPGGLSRGEILSKMGLKGDKAGEMSISNGLTALTKGSQVTREGGKYRLA